MRSEGKVGFGVTLVLIAGLLCWCGAYASSADDPAVARRALEDMGLTNIEIYDSHLFVSGWYGCGKDDAVAYEARAKNPAGRPVEVVVCAGWPLKAATVRSR